MVAYYAGTSTLDIDVLKVGHHGSKNGTTVNELAAATPDFAVISCGLWDDGKDDNETFSTWAYGHPTMLALRKLSDAISILRPSPIVAMVGEGSRNFRRLVVKKNIFATAWDGNIVIEATPAGVTRVLTHQPTPN